MPNNGTPSGKKQIFLRNILVYFKKRKFGKSEKVFKILVEFGKDFQRKEKKKKYTEDFPLMESQNLGLGIFLALHFLFFITIPKKKKVLKIHKFSFMKDNLSKNLKWFSIPFFFCWVKFAC